MTGCPHHPGATLGPSSLGHSLGPQAAGRQWPRRPVCPGSQPFPEKALQEHLALCRPPRCCLLTDCWTNCGEPAAVWTLARGSGECNLGFPGFLSGKWAPTTSREKAPHKPRFPTAATPTLQGQILLGFQCELPNGQRFPPVKWKRSPRWGQGTALPSGPTQGPRPKGTQGLLSGFPSAFA